MPVKTSKIVSIERSWDKKHDSQECFISPVGVMWVFYVKFENNDIGKYRSIEEYPEKFAKGKTVTYSIEIEKGGLYPEYVVRTAKPLSERAKKKLEKSKEKRIMTPKEIKQNCKITQIVNAVFAYKVFKKLATSKETTFGLAEKFTRWCLDISDKTQVNTRITAIRMAVTAMQDSIKMEQSYIDFSDFPFGIKEVEIKNSDDILKIADLFYQYSLTD